MRSRAFPFRNVFDTNNDYHQAVTHEPKKLNMDRSPGKGGNRFAPPGFIGIRRKFRMENVLPSQRTPFVFPHGMIWFQINLPDMRMCIGKCGNVFSQRAAVTATPAMTVADISPSAITFDVQATQIGFGFKFPPRATAAFQSDSPNVPAARARVRALLWILRRRRAYALFRARALRPRLRIFPCRRRCV